MECPRRDIAERLALALWPDDFPKESKEILEHVRVCPTCREELNMLERVYKVLKENRVELAGAASGCPSVESITRFAKGEHVDGSVPDHLECCPDCREEVALIRESLQSAVTATDEAPSAATMARVRRAVDREYGATEQTVQRSLAARVRDLLGSFRIPMMVAGAVAAGVLLMVLMPHAPREQPFQVALSTTVWDTAPPTMDKTGDLFEHPPKNRTRVALVLMLKESGTFSSPDADDVYRRIQIPDQLSERYEFLSPAKLTEVIGDLKGKTVPANELAREVFAKTDAEDFLAFQVESDQTGTSVKATLFHRPDVAAVASLSQSGLQNTVLPQRIMGISADLLAGSERKKNDPCSRHIR